MRTKNSRFRISRIAGDFQRWTDSGAGVGQRLGFGKLVHLTDPRANNARLSFADLLRQSSRLAGYEDVNDAEQLSRIRPSG